MWARSIDLLLFEAILGRLIHLVAPQPLEDYETLAAIMVFTASSFVWVLVEPLFLTRFSATPGKMVWRIAIKRRDGQPMTYWVALSRAVDVWIRGLGASIPPVGLITSFLAWRTLVNRGETTWDRDGGFVVVHGEVGPLRAFVGVGLCFVIIALAGSR